MRPSLLPWSLFMLIVLAYLLALMAAGGGRLALPLDDAYIYLQYAQHASQGHWFQYNTGDPVSSGATGLLWLGWLSLGALVLTGQGLVWYAFASCALFLGLALQRFLVLAQRWAVPLPLAGALLLLCGPLVSASFNGLESALYFALLLSAIEALDRKASALQVAPLLAMLAFCRPEGQIAALILGAWAWRREPGAEGRALYMSAIAFSLLPSLCFVLLTGSTSPDSLRPKSPLFAPGLSLSRHANLSLEYLVDMAKGLLMGSYGPAESVGQSGSGTSGNSPAIQFAPLTLALALWGFSLRWHDEARRHGIGWALALIFGLSMLALGLALPVGWNHHRYLAPLTPLLCVALLSAAAELKAQAGRGSQAWRAAFTAFNCLLISFGLLSSAALLLASQSSAQTYAESHGRLARLVAKVVRPGARIAVQDAGILAYESGHAIQDLQGVTDHSAALIARQGTGALLEALAARPESQRPRLAVLQDDRAEFPIDGLTRIGLLSPIYLNQTPTHSRMGLYHLNLEGFAKSHNPCSAPKGWKVVDTLNTGELGSEAEHGWSAQTWGPSLANQAAVAGAGQSMLADAGRLIQESETFHLQGSKPGKRALMLRLKTGAPGILRLLCADSGDLPTTRVAADGMRFQELFIPLPDASQATQGIDLRASLIDTVSGELAYSSCHWWLLEP